MKKSSKVLMFSVLLVFLVAGSASAAAILTLDDGMGNSVSISDGGPGDLNLTVGVITYSAPLGSWFVNVSTGFTKPALGGVNFPELDLNSANMSSGPGTLTVTFEDDGFNLPDTFPGFRTDIGGTTKGTVSVTSDYDDTSLYDFGDASLLSTLGPLGPGVFAATGVALVNPDDPFALRLTAQITHTAAGQITSFDTWLIPVPTPAAAWLLGAGLIGVVGIRRKFKN